MDEDGPELLEARQERDLVDAVRAGDDSARNTFAQRFVPPLLRFVRARAGGDGTVDAEDVVQITMLNALKGLDHWRGDARLFTWLCTIALRELSRLGQREAQLRSRQVNVDSDLLEDLANATGLQGEDPAAIARRQQLRELVHLTLDLMPGSQARAIELKYGQGWSSQAIAEELGVSDVAAQSLLARGRRAFRASLPLAMSVAEDEI